jgi:type IV pilus assembly protein PilO
MKGLNSLTMPQRLWLFAGACFLLIAYLAYNFYETEYVAYSTQVESLDAEIRRKKGELRQILAQKQRINDLQEEIRVADLEFKRLREMFPDEEIIPRRLIDLTTVTRKSLTIPTKFLPLRVEEKEFYKENHYAITISSSYHALGMLFGEVANFPYPTAINKLTIDKASDLDKEVEDAKEHGETPRTIVANFQLTTFTSKN